MRTRPSSCATPTTSYSRFYGRGMTTTFGASSRRPAAGGGLEGGEVRADAVAERGDLLRPTSRRSRPLGHLVAAVLARRSGVARDEVHVEVPYLAVAEDEAVDVLGALDDLERAGQVADQPPECGGLVIGEVAEPDDVPFRFGDQVAEVGVAPTDRVGVTGVHEVVLVDHPTLDVSPLAVLVADEARVCRHARRWAQGPDRPTMRGIVPATHGGGPWSGTSWWRTGPSGASTSSRRCGTGWKRATAGSTSWCR